MIQLDILTGTKAGSRSAARRFPFTVGRGKGAALSLADEGVWDSHFEVTWQPGEGFLLAARPEALTVLNGEAVAGPVRLHNGDLIEAGAVRFRFGLSPVRSGAGAWRDGLFWIALALLCLSQIALISFVLP